jgi:hypothetical protein
MSKNNLNKGKYLMNRVLSKQELNSYCKASFLYDEDFKWFFDVYTKTNPASKEKMFWATHRINTINSFDEKKALFIHLFNSKETSIEIFSDLFWNGLFYNVTSDNPVYKFDKETNFKNCLHDKAFFLNNLIKENNYVEEFDNFMTKSGIVNVDLLLNMAYAMDKSQRKYDLPKFLNKFMPVTDNDFIALIKVGTHFERDLANDFLNKIRDESVNNLKVHMEATNAIKKLGLSLKEVDINLFDHDASQVIYKKSSKFDLNAFSYTGVKKYNIARVGANFSMFLFNFYKTYIFKHEKKYNKINGITVNESMVRFRFSFSEEDKKIIFNVSSADKNLTDFLMERLKEDLVSIFNFSKENEQFIGKIFDASYNLTEVEDTLNKVLMARNLNKILEKKSDFKKPKI